MSHDLKTWPAYWDAIARGEKTFEVRKNDRGYKCGDTLILRHFDPENNTFDGGVIEADVTYILHGPQFGVQEGFCVMAISVNTVNFGS